MCAQLAASLSDNHRRGISSTLWVLDEMLCQFERWARGVTCEGVVFGEHDDMSEDQARAILAEVTSMRAVMTELREDLALKHRKKSAVKSISAQCSWFWESLVDLKSQRLGRYGDVPQDFAAYFDPRIQVLIDHLHSIAESSRRSDPEHV